MIQIDPEQYEKVLKYIRSGIESGAKLETGGEKIGSKGYFIQPTVFSDVKVSPLTISQATIFYKDNWKYDYDQNLILLCNFTRTTC